MGRDRKVCTDITNSTTLTWEEKHRARYLNPQDLVRPHVEEVEDGYMAKWPYHETYIVFDRISGHHLVRSEDYTLDGRNFVRKRRFRNLEILCQKSDTDAMERCRELADEVLGGIKDGD